MQDLNNLAELNYIELEKEARQLRAEMIRVSVQSFWRKLSRTGTRHAAQPVS